MKKPLLLIIRDGWGLNPSGREGAQRDGNAVLLAKTPFHDHLYAAYPWGHLRTCGLDVGLPEGQMGNSEVGHLNLGAGRIVYQDLTRISLAIQDGSFFKNSTLTRFFTKLRSQQNSALHLIGLVSNGGVHSHQEHLHALLKMAKEQGLTDVRIHVITDGRDTSPTSGASFVEKLEEQMAILGIGKIVTLVGRYYAMDRDKRWDRTQRAYQLMTQGEGLQGEHAAAALQASYEKGVTDEFVEPVSFVEPGKPLIRGGDGILFFNFRADRIRQLIQALMEPDFMGFERTPPSPLSAMSLTQYDPRFATWGMQVAFEPQSMRGLLGEVISAHGLTQCRMAETEKYPHVTYFFNGGNETPYDGEERLLVPSPKVATYDLQPQMSALELTEAILEKLGSGAFDFFVINYANPDMVGHTGVLQAAIQAVETIDACVKRVVEKALVMQGSCIITADHGNCERMLTEDGKPYTAHTTYPVDCIYVASGVSPQTHRVHDGILADIAPTLLSLLNLPQPPEMTGHALIAAR